jgi:8-oxo-dGTP diphosphatase
MGLAEKCTLNLRVSAVCIQDENVLLVKHKRFTDTDKFPEAYWILPGGVVERGETMTDALKREVMEETGFQCEVGNFLFVKELLYPFPSTPDQGKIHHSVTIGFYCTITGGTLMTGMDPEFPEDKQVILETNWLPIDSLETHHIYPPFLIPFLKDGHRNNFEHILPEYFDSYE